VRIKRKFVLLALGSIFLILPFLFGRADAERAAKEPREPSEHALLADTGSCSLAAVDARAWAADSERKARARWERAWYQVTEAPAALRELMLAIACYRMVGDREARARAERDLVHWQREFEQRYARARVELTLALRADDAAGIIEESTRLTQLLSQAASDADPYREYLRRLAQSARAKRIERQNAQQER